MLYRSVGNILIVEKQWRDGDALERMVEELVAHLRVERGDITHTHVGIRPAIRVRFPSKEAASSAEAWIEREFEF